MKKLCFIFYAFVIFFGQTYAAESCYSEKNEVLGCFLKHNDGIYKYEFLSEKSSNNPNVTIKTYLLYSQQWPIGDYQDMPSTVWKHKLVFYIPKNIRHNKVLLYVNGGYNIGLNGQNEFSNPKESLNFVSIASDAQAVVVELQDVPNQFLFFDGLPKKEDQILAYTYNKFISDPQYHAYLPGHLPMAKSVVKAMDAVQDILKEQHAIDGFILSGASKRGWAVWLAALGDARVEAIIPIVINMLNTQQSIIHTCKSYGGICPPALRDYEEQNFTNYLTTEKFSQLMEIEDPYSYLNITKYKERLSIPKYIINASGDDFFVPDSTKLYFKELPGNNFLRYLPNSMHYIGGNFISDATDSLQRINHDIYTYFSFILNNTLLPQINWKFTDNQLNIFTSVQPKEIKLWVAHNAHNRDFRYLNSYAKSHIFIKKIKSFFSKNLCDNCYVETKTQTNFTCKGLESTNCKIQISLPLSAQGWQAVFAELHYDIGNADFIVTTDVNITPDMMPVVKNGNDREL